MIAVNALAVALGFAIVAQEAPPSPADLGGNSATDSPADEAGEAEDDVGGVGAGSVSKRALGDNGRVGLALMATGAVVATSTAAGATLIEALARNDSDPNAPPRNPELVQVGGFTTLTLMSLSAGAMLIGSALVVNDVLTPPSADASAE